jgi:3-oxoadipate enol-lactonase
MVSKTVTVANVSFHVLDEGPQNGPLVVLSHALMADNRMWDSTVLALHKAGYRTLRYDHMGHGRTPPPPGSSAGFSKYHFDDFTRHIRQLIEQATTSSPANPRPEHSSRVQLHAVIGCSMGGVLALRYAMLYPGTASYIICCDAPGMTSLETSKTKWRARLAQFRAEGVDNLASATVERWFPDPCEEAVKEKALQQTRACTLEGYEVCAEGIMNYDYETEFRRIGEVGEKVMVLVGENDAAVGPPEILKGVAEGIKGSEYVVVEDAGHLPPMHRAEEFERIVLDFLGR